jgi:hypothetical protein
MTRTTALSMAISAAIVFLPPRGEAQSDQLALVFQNMFGTAGLRVNSDAVLPDGSTHSAHFNSGFQSDFTQINIALASQLTALPLPSPASGFTYTFDTSTGTFLRSTQSFGPILTDRAETIGRGKFSFGFNSQFFSFDTIEGVDLAAVPAVFTHDDFQLGGGRSDVVTTTNVVQATVAQMTAVVSYGLTNRMDVSLAVPMVRTRLGVRSDATIRRIGTADSPAAHFFRDPDAPGTFGTERQFTAGGTASGMGDLIIRVKGTAVREAQRALAVGLEVRLPSGDERNLLGSGAYGVKPFLALSASYGRLSPHADIGYQWNGMSLLAGDVKENRKARLPAQVLYAVGLDVGVHPRLTLAVDVLGQRVIDSPRLVQRRFISPADGEQFPDIGFVTTTYSIHAGAAGFKINLAQRLLGTFNVRFHLGSGGLADRASPLVGIEYGF